MKYNILPVYRTIWIHLRLKSEYLLQGGWNEGDKLGGTEGRGWAERRGGAEKIRRNFSVVSLDFRKSFQGEGRHF